MGIPIQMAPTQMTPQPQFTVIHVPVTTGPHGLQLPQNQKEYHIGCLLCFIFSLFGLIGYKCFRTQYFLCGAYIGVGMSLVGWGVFVFVVLGIKGAETAGFLLVASGFPFMVVGIRRKRFLDLVQLIPTPIPPPNAP